MLILFIKWKEFLYFCKETYDQFYDFINQINWIDKEMRTLNLHYGKAVRSFNDWRYLNLCYFWYFKFIASLIIINKLSHKEQNLYLRQLIYLWCLKNEKHERPKFNIISQLGFRITYIIQILNANFYIN